MRRDSRIGWRVVFGAVLAVAAGRAAAQPLGGAGDPDRNVRLRIQLDRPSMKAFEPVYILLSAEQFAQNLDPQISIRKGDDPWQPVALPPDPWRRFESRTGSALPVLKIALPLLVAQIGDKPRFLFSQPGDFKLRIKVGPDGTVLPLVVTTAAPDDEKAATILGTDLFPRLFEPDHHSRPDDKVKAAAARVVAEYPGSTTANYCKAYLQTAQFRSESLKREPPPANKAFYGPLAADLDESAAIFHDTFFGEEMAFYAAYAHGLSGDFEGLLKTAAASKTALTPWADALTLMKKDVQRHVRPTGGPMPEAVEIPESALPKPTPQALTPEGVAMMRVFCRVIALAVAAGVADSAARLAAVPATQPATLPATLPYDEFQQAADLLHLRGEVLDRFEAQVAKRHAAFAEWQAGETGRKEARLREQLDGARRAHDAARMKLLQAEIAPLSREEMAFRGKIRAEVWALLSLEQQRLWAGHVLETRSLGAFKKIELTPEQQAQREACRRLGAEYLEDGMLLEDPYLKGMIPLRAVAVDEITRHVLTDAQRAVLHPTTRPATQPATRPNADLRPGR